jgi:hypothetical protein
LDDVSQQTPLELTWAFPSLVILPPVVTDVWVISLISLVVTTGVVDFFIQKVKQSKEQIKRPTIIGILDERFILEFII